MSDLARRVLAGDTRAAARLCRLVDDRSPAAAPALAEVIRGSRAARLVGITGPPGAGKSTLTSALVAALRERGERVGVVAVDPSSPLTGGAILGDRIRMGVHFEDPEVFIRSVASRGAVGGLSATTRDVVRALEGWGARVVIIETVGVGQDALDVTRLAETTVLVLAPGQGDDVQAQKAGILECADLLVVNKADRPGADAAVRELEAAVALGQLPREALAAGGHHGGAALRLDPARAAFPRVLRTVATRGDGVAGLLRALDEHAEHLATPEGLALRRSRLRALAGGLLREAVGALVDAELGGVVDELARILERRGEDDAVALDSIARRLLRAALTGREAGAAADA